MALWRFRPLSRSRGHPHSFLENTYLLESEAYAPIEQLILNQLLGHTRKPRRRRISTQPDDSSKSWRNGGTCRNWLILKVDPPPKSGPQLHTGVRKGLERTKFSADS
jgi:hypothetical protein